MKYVLVLLSFLCGSAWADAVFKDGELNVTLTDKTCENFPLFMALVPFGDSNKISVAVITFKGQEIPACWIEQDGKVYIIDAAGQSGYIERSEFK